MAKEVLVRWKIRSACIQNGMSSPRTAGDEDVLPLAQARMLRVSGQVEFLDPESHGVRKLARNERKVGEADAVVEGDFLDSEGVPIPELDTFMEGTQDESYFS